METLTTATATSALLLGCCSDLVLRTRSACSGGLDPPACIYLSDIFLQEKSSGDHDQAKEEKRDEKHITTARRAKRGSTIFVNYSKQTKFTIKIKQLQISNSFNLDWEQEGNIRNWITGKRDEHGHGKWEGKQKGRSDKRITESKTRQKEALHCAQT
jgi:hypothetical protein